MAATNEIMPEQHPFTLIFKDKDLEQRFRASYDKSVKFPLRGGIIISILAWLASLLLVAVVIPEQLAELSVLTCGIILTVFGFILFSTFSNSFSGYYHTLGAVSNALAGLYAIYFCDQFPDGVNITLPVLIFIMFFGSYMIRLRWIVGFVAALMYILGYHIYIVLYSDLASTQVVLYTFVGWLTLVFSFVAGRVTEANNRVAFVQRKTIREQSVIIQNEKEASEKLLENMLPPFIARRLKEGDGIIADNHNDASVLFADLVGFTDLSAKLPATSLVAILNSVFSQFDRLTEKHELEKIKTIGDGYMVAGGLSKNKVDHLTRIASLAIDMIHFLENDEDIKKHNLKVRIGINSGAVVAGVIGRNKFTYDLWGNTVNVASRMESQGITGKIHVTEVVKLRLQSNFDFEKIAPIEIKGKGMTQTFFLTKKKDN